MPRYEMALILKCLDRVQTVQMIKRTATAITDYGGILRSFENVGQRKLPYKMSNHGETHWMGHYYIINFDSPVSLLPTLNDHLARDLDIIRPRILRKEIELSRPCESGPCDWGEITDEKIRRVEKSLDFCLKKL